MRTLARYDGKTFAGLDASRVTFRTRANVRGGDRRENGDPAQKIRAMAPDGRVRSQPGESIRRSKREDRLRLRTPAREITASVALCSRDRCLGFEAAARRQQGLNAKFCRRVRGVRTGRAGFASRPQAAWRRPTPETLPRSDRYSAWMPNVVRASYRAKGLNRRGSGARGTSTAEKTRIALAKFSTA